jgi:hypothetical protein
MLSWSRESNYPSVDLSKLSRFASTCQRYFLIGVSRRKRRLLSKISTSSFSVPLAVKFALPAVLTTIGVATSAFSEEHLMAEVFYTGAILSIYHFFWDKAAV